MGTHSAFGKGHWIEDILRVPGGRIRERSQMVITRGGRPDVAESLAPLWIDPIILEVPPGRAAAATKLGPGPVLAARAARSSLSMMQAAAPAKFAYLIGAAALALAGGCQKSRLYPEGETGGPGAGPGGGGPGGPGFVLPEPRTIMPPPMVEEKACATESRLPERTPVDLLFVVDASSSMLEVVDGGTQQKWLAAREAIQGFMADPGSAGLNVGLQFFPLRAVCASDKPVCLGPNNPPGPIPDCPCPFGLTCVTAGTCTVSGGACTEPGGLCATGVADDRCRIVHGCPGLEPSCDPAVYRQLAVPFGALPANLPAVMTAIGATDPARNSGTPTGVAVAAALDVLRAQAPATAARRAALVLVTDGEPTRCLPGDPLAGAARAAAGRAAVVGPITAARMANPVLSVFAVGVFSQSDIAMGFSSIVTEVATAGGTAPFVVAANRDLTQVLQEAFNQIRRLAVPCEYLIPQPQQSVLDYGKVNVHVKSGTRDEDLPYVARASACDPTRGGWYYDVDPAFDKPSRVVLCPTACTGLQNDPLGKVDLRFGCKSQIIN